jgi:hypothetical protein
MNGQLGIAKVEDPEKTSRQKLGIKSIDPSSEQLGISEVSDPTGNEMLAYEPLPSSITQTEKPSIRERLGLFEELGKKYGAMEETAATAATGLISWIPAGLYAAGKYAATGISEIAKRQAEKEWQDLGGKLPEGWKEKRTEELERELAETKETTEKIQEKLTYKPKFFKEDAEGYLKVVNAPFKWLAEKGEQAGNAVYEATGNEELAALTHTAIEGAPFWVPVAAKSGFKMVKGKGKLPKGETAEIPKEAIKPIEEAPTEMPKVETGAIITEKVKPKEAPIIEEAKGVPGIESLAQEARKYKSVEEFVKAQGEPLYHGTAAEFKEFDFGKTGTVKTSDWGQEGIYFDTSREGANYYRKEALKATNKELDAAYKKYDDIVKKLPPRNKYDSTPDYNEASRKALKEFQELAEKIEKEKGGNIIEAYIDKKAKVYKHYFEGGSITDPYLSEYAKGKGYDVIEIWNKYPEGQHLSEVLVLNPKVIRTKAQLTDIWNKAQAKPPIIEEAKSVPEKKVAEPAKAKQPWEMTREEWKAQEESRTFYKPKWNEEAVKEYHARQIEQALSEGKPIPRNVLEEYKGEPWAAEVEAKEIPSVESLKETEAELGKEVNQVIDEISQRGELTLREPTAKIPIHAFADKATEKRFQTAKGIQKPSILQHAVDILISIKNRATREYEHLPKGEKYTPLRNDLLRLSKSKDIASDRTLRGLQGITVNLNKREFDLFTRKVILDDLKYTAEKDMELPFGLTKETLPNELSKVDTLISQSPNIQRSIVKRQKLWAAIKDNYLKTMKDVGFDVSERFKNEQYFRHQVLEYANAKGIVGAGKKLKTPTQRGFLKKRYGSQLDINTDYLQVEYEVISQMLHDIEIAKTLRNIDKNYNIIDQVKKSAKDQGMDDWREAIPEEHDLWQPREGNVFYQANSIPEYLAHDLVNESLKKMPAETFLKEGDIRKILAVGGKRKQWILPNEVIATINDLTKSRTINPLSQVSKSTLRGWKVWQLISPRRWFKYNFRNLTGDSDAVFAGNPATFKKVPQAVSDLYNLYAKNKMMSPELKDFFDRGGMQSTLQFQEMGDINNLRIFRGLAEKTKGFKQTPIWLWKSYWRKARLTTDFRETVLRYAAYLDYLESMKKSPTGRPKNFGASKPEEIMALADIKDRAFWLSNDLLGAYDKVSVMGQTLRNHWIPFWSWKEVNFKRYLQLYKNALSDGKFMEFLGKRGAAKFAKLPYQAYRLGKLTTATLSFWAMLQAWNQLRFPQEEKALPDNVRNMPHLIMGRDKDGKIIYFSRLGAVTDLMEWVGLDNIYGDLRDIFDGKKTLKEVMTEMMKSPVNVIVNSTSPFVKTPAELLTKQSLFPDAFEPRTIRDEGLYIARSIGLENEYKEISGLPSKDYAESLGQFFYYKIDPGQAAYGDIMNMKHRFLKKIGKGSVGFWLTPRGDALYNMKLAVRYEDEEAARKYLQKYIALGGTKEGMVSSFKAMNPLSGMTQEEQVKFVNSLSIENKKKLVAALNFYTHSLLGIKNVEPVK